MAVRRGKKATTADVWRRARVINSEELVRLVLLETRQLQAHIAAVLAADPRGAVLGAEAADSDPALAAQLVTHHLAAQRNKRCLLAYHHSRLGHLRAKLWQKGGSLALVFDDAIEEGRPEGASGGARDGAVERGTLRSRMSADEVTWLKRYAQLVTAYKSDFLDVVDVAAPLQRSADKADVGPIKELMVSVMALRDARDVQTERGSINLRKGERMRVQRSEVEPLIVRGWLGVLDD